jgi:hypothetical protein
VALIRLNDALMRSTDQVWRRKINFCTHGHIRNGRWAQWLSQKHERLYDCRVVYFATHALRAGDIEKFTRAKPSLPWFCLSRLSPRKADNGLLTASEVATLKLNADSVDAGIAHTGPGIGHIEKHHAWSVANTVIHSGNGP